MTNNWQRGDKLQTKQKNKRPTIGFLTHGIDYNIGLERYLGADQKCIELDFNLFCVMHESHNERTSVAELEYSNLFYQLLSQQLNGLACGITASSYTMSKIDFTQLVIHNQIPKVSLLQIDNIPQIRFNDYQGMHETLLHLIKGHGLRRIFYVRGPGNNTISSERYQAYQDLMMEYGYFDPKLVSPPLNWNPKLEQLSVEQLLGDLQPGRDVEAIAAVNDMWALEFIEKLEEKGVRIPDELAVFGINDSFHGKNCNVPLTSVAYPFYEQGYQALGQLSQLLQGKSVSDLFLATKLVIRRSCGCPDPEIAAITRDDSMLNLQPYSNSPLPDQGRLTAQIIQCFQPNPPDWLPDQIAKIIQAFWLDINQQSPGNFLEVINNALKNDINTATNHWIAWQNALAAFRQEVLTGIKPEQRVTAVRLFHQARQLLDTFIRSSLEHQIIKKQDHTRLVNQLQAEMSRIFNHTEMVNLLAEYLPKIGFKRCYLVLYADPQPYVFPQEIPKYSRLIMGFNQNGRIEVGNDGLYFLTEQFLPDRLFDRNIRFTLFASPLFVGENQFGYLITELAPAAYSFYKVLCNQIEYCLWGINLFQRQKNVEESLARSNKELEQFAYISSHDLQEPLRKIIAFGDRVKQCYTNGLFEQGQDYLERVQSAAVRMQVLINDLLTYSRVTTKAQPFSKIELTKIINEVLSDLEVKINQTRARIDMNLLPAITADPLQMRQLFQNIIGNALKFCRHGVAPVIRIYTLPGKDDVVRIVIEDNGIGIDANYHERIFGVFERLHGRSEYEGSGVGLAICKKIIERHNGTIRIESVVGEGSKFIIALPC
jgi:signal transduction histidine kinase/DNA-binding LacI/PurR family transcriptional regulator